MSKKSGRSARLYWLAATREAWPAEDAPVGIAEVTSAGDISVRPRPSEGDASSRASIYKQALVGKTELEVTVHFTYDPSDAWLTALKTAMLAGTPIALAIADGDVTVNGTRGFWADWAVVGWDESPGLEGAWGVDVTLKPHAGSSVPPEAFTVVVTP